MNAGSRTRHSPEQIVKKLRDADALLNVGKTIGEVCQALEVSENSDSQCPPCRTFCSR